MQRDLCVNLSMFALVVELLSSTGSCCHGLRHANAPTPQGCGASPLSGFRIHVRGDHGCFLFSNPTPVSTAALTAHPPRRTTLSLDHCIEPSDQADRWFVVRMGRSF